MITRLREERADDTLIFRPALPLRFVAAAYPGLTPSQCPFITEAAKIRSGSSSAKRVKRRRVPSALESLRMVKAQNLPSLSTHRGWKTARSVNVIANDNAHQGDIAADDKNNAAGALKTWKFLRYGNQLSRNQTWRCQIMRVRVS